MRLQRFLVTLVREAQTPMPSSTRCPHCFAPIDGAGGYKVVCENPQCRRTVYLYTKEDKAFLRKAPLRIADPDREVE